MAATKAKRSKSRRRRPSKPKTCLIDGCENPPTEQLETRHGKVWLCEDCAKLAKVDLPDAERALDVMDGTAAPPAIRSQTRREVSAAIKVQEQLARR